MTGATQAARRRGAGCALRARARPGAAALLARHAAVLLPVQARHRRTAAPRRAAALGSMDRVRRLGARPAHPWALAPGHPAVPAAAVSARLQAESPACATGRGVGALLLARRLGAGAWAATIAALTYAGCGFLCAMTASNLPFALGHATLPLAVWAILRFTDAPGPSRLLLAAAVLGSCGLAGEPQSMLLAGLIAGTWALLGAGVRAAPRMLARLALCGACGVLLSAPATFPAAERLRLGDARRLEQAAGMFSLDVRRLPGLALPWAFDDTPQLAGAGSDTPYSEYFSGEPHVAFADSIALGLPALILAAFGGPALLAGAALFLLAAMGTATPVQWLAAHLIPGFALFRYPEKLVGPASLLLALAAATGAQRVLADRIAARRALVAAAAAAGVLLALRAGIHLWNDELVAWLVAHGRTRAG